jgi:hypothetical protein
MSSPAINHPSHYNSHPSGVECITIAQHHTFNVGNAIKYLWRAGLKPVDGEIGAEAAIQDLRKAVFYLNAEVERISQDAKNAATATPSSSS